MLLPIEPGISRRPWGGTRLAELAKGAGEPVGETWHLSVHPQAPGTVAGAPLDQRLAGKEMPYLVKLIDTAAPLSVQVHPGDEFARKVEGTRGKTECWIILAAGEGEGIYLGLRPQVTRERFARAIEQKADLSEYLRFYPVRAGDFFYVPAGTVHAIGKNVFLAEVQQSSEATYRIWDWNRPGRELHIEKAMRVINFEPSANADEAFQIKRKLFDHFGRKLLARHSDFALSFCHLPAGESCEIPLPNSPRAQGLLTLRGKGSFGAENSGPWKSYLLTGANLSVRAQTDFAFIHVH